MEKVVSPDWDLCHIWTRQQVDQQFLTLFAHFSSFWQMGWLPFVKKLEKFVWVFKFQNFEIKAWTDLSFCRSSTIIRITFVQVFLKVQKEFSNRFILSKWIKRLKSFWFFHQTIFSPLDLKYEQLYRHLFNSLLTSLQVFLIVKRLVFRGLYLLGVMLNKKSKCFDYSSNHLDRKMAANRQLCKILLGEKC